MREGDGRVGTRITCTHVLHSFSTCRLQADTTKNRLQDSPHRPQPPASLAHPGTQRTMRREEKGREGGEMKGEGGGVR